MKTKHHYLFVIIFFLLLITPTLSQASGFFSTHFNSLETKVQKSFQPNFILEKLAQLKSFPDWPQDLNADLKLYIALKWIDRRNFNEAAQIIDGIASQVSDSELFQFTRVNLMVERGVAELVKDDLTPLLTKYKKDPDILLLQSSVYAQSGEIGSAIDVLNYLIDKNKHDGTAYLHRGMLKIVAIAHGEALQDFAKAEKYLPKNQIREHQQALFQSGLIYLKTFKDAAKAKLCFEKGLALDPNSNLAQDLQRALQP